MTSSTLSGITPYHPANQSEAVIGGEVLNVGERTLLGVIAARGVAALMGGVAGSRLGTVGAAGGFVAGALAGPAAVSAVVPGGLSVTGGLISAYPNLLAHIAGTR